MKSRDKGKRGEREWAAELRKLGCPDAARGVQHSGAPEAPDVRGSWPGTHPEVKRVQSLNIYSAIQQAVRDAGNQVPYVAHRRNHQPWLVTIRADDLLEFCRRVVAVVGLTPETP